ERAEKEVREIRSETEGELDDRRQQLIDLEKRVADREDILGNKLTEFDEKETEVKKKEEELATEQESLEELRVEEEGKLTEIAGLSSEQAEARVLELAEQRTQELIVQRVRKLEKEGEKQLDDKARDILSTIIQRYASSHVSETTTSHVHVEDENLIGRVIGKEGRNIQHLERLTGCEIIVDETPNSIMVSGFSPLSPLPPSVFSLSPPPALPVDSICSPCFCWLY
ncbi:unnamed protein product, partial [marine sediment metagenome]